MKIFLTLFVFGFVLTAQQTTFAAIASGFLPKVSFYCEAEGYQGSTLQSVIGGAGVNPTEASDMAIHQCDDVEGLEDCKVISCWSEENFKRGPSF